MNPDSDAAQDPATPVAEPDYATPNDLNFELSAEQEQVFVDKVLGNPTGEVPIEAQPEPVTPSAPVVPETPATPAPETPVLEPIIPEPVETPSIKTDDLYVEVEKVVTDDVGEETTEKIKLTYDPEHPENFIPDDFKAKNDKQLASILEAKGEMAKLYSDRKAEFDKVESDKQTKIDTDNSNQAILDSWDGEIKDLIEIGSIPEPKLKEGDEGYLDDPSVKLTDAVFQFMTKTNAERQTEGKPVIRSFGTAFAMYQKTEADSAATDKKKKENAEAKAKGSLVGGSSAASPGSERSTYVAGSARNIWEVKV